MLTYFPQTYPDELLYSVLARYHQHVCPGGVKQNLAELFGSRSVRAAVDLQTGLGALSDPTHIAIDNDILRQTTADRSRSASAIPVWRSSRPRDWVHSEPVGVTAVPLGLD